MSNAQKEYLKKWAIGIGCVLTLALLFTSLAIGGIWATIGLVVVSLIVLGCVGVLLATAIGTLIWHWRLMGVCENEWEEHMLAYWWRWMGYWGGDWEELIAQIIAEDYEQNTQDYVLRMELYDKFRAVKAPKVLQW